MDEVKCTNEDECPNEEFVMVTRFWGIFEGFLKHNIEKAQEARRLQGMIGNPT